MIRVRYRPNELGESGVVEILDADRFEVLDDNTVKLSKFNPETEKYKTCGFIHPHRWESVMNVEDVNAG